MISERREHVALLAARLTVYAKHVVVLQGGMSTGQRREAAESLATIAEDEKQVLVATRRYLGEGFTDTRTLRDSPAASGRREFACQEVALPAAEVVERVRAASGEGVVRSDGAKELPLLLEIHLCPSLFGGVDCSTLVLVGKLLGHLSLERAGWLFLGHLVPPVCRPGYSR